MSNKLHCTSCTMPIETGLLCQHCSDDKGELRPFDELFERMVQWSVSQNPGLERSEAERQTLEFMAQRPAWRDHPDLQARRS